MATYSGYAEIISGIESQVDELSRASWKYPQQAPALAGRVEYSNGRFLFKDENGENAALYELDGDEAVFSVADANIVRGSFDVIFVRKGVDDNMAKGLCMLISVLPTFDDALTGMWYDSGGRVMALRSLAVSVDGNTVYFGDNPVGVINTQASTLSTKSVYGMRVCFTGYTDDNGNDCAVTSLPYSLAVNNNLSSTQIVSVSADSRYPYTGVVWNLKAEALAATQAENANYFITTLYIDIKSLVAKANTEQSPLNWLSTALFGKVDYALCAAFYITSNGGVVQLNTPPAEQKLHNSSIYLANASDSQSRESVASAFNNSTDLSTGGPAEYRCALLDVYDKYDSVNGYGTLAGQSVFIGDVQIIGLMGRYLRTMCPYHNSVEIGAWWNLATLQKSGSVVLDYNDGDCASAGRSVCVRAWQGNFQKPALCADGWDGFNDGNGKSDNGNVVTWDSAIGKLAVADFDSLLKARIGVLIAQQYSSGDVIHFSGTKPSETLYPAAYWTKQQENNIVLGSSASEKSLQLSNLSGSFNVKCKNYKDWPTDPHGFSEDETGNRWKLVFNDNNNPLGGTSKNISETNLEVAVRVTGEIDNNVDSTGCVYPSNIKNLSSNVWKLTRNSTRAV